MNDNDPTLQTALITGASSGIGQQLAREFARHGHPVVLVAPVAAEVEDLADALEREFSIRAYPIAQDLTEDDSAMEIFDELSAEGIEVAILANNAGRGQRGKFWETSPETDLEMIRLNVEAVVRLTRLFLPPMIKRGQGRILNTASVAGFEPGPLLAVYHATKAFVLSFSESLATELEDTGVTLTALCPGPTDTDFFAKADMVDTQAFQKANVMAPQTVAEAAYEALMKGQRVVVPGAMNKVMIAGRRVTSEETQAKMNEKLYTKTDERKREPGDIAAKHSES
jgi:short-subunit dehydrogenase